MDCLWDEALNCAVGGCNSSSKILLLKTDKTGLVTGEELNIDGAWENVDARESLRSKLPDLLGRLNLDDDL